MIRIVLTLALVLAASLGALAEPEFEPAASEREKVAECLQKVAGEPELKQMAACIGVIGDACAEAPGANTVSIVACQMREQKIWDGYLNQWYGEANKRLADDKSAQAALKNAQRAWITFREAKCGYWQKRYEGGTIASVVTGDCMRVETGRRALEMRVILDDLDH